MNESHTRIGRYALYDLEFYLIRLMHYIASDEYRELNDIDKKKMYNESREVETFIEYGWRILGRPNVKRIIGIETATGIATHYSAIGIAARATGVNKGNIMNVINGDRKTAGGYSWEEVK